MEKRHFIRKTLFLYLDIFDKRTGELLGHLGDLSKGGLMILANKPIFSRIKHLKIRLPEGEFSKEFIEAKVEICWARADINPNIYCVGCHFLKIDSADLVIVEEMVKDMSF